jgi:hypothetical protein
MIEESPTQYDISYPSIVSIVDAQYCQQNVDVLRRLSSLLNRRLDGSFFQFFSCLTSIKHEINLITSTLFLAASLPSSINVLLATNLEHAWSCAAGKSAMSDSGQLQVPGR